MIFVFGSNKNGTHGAGAARYAYEKHGAEWGVGEGRTGNAYAIPTKGYGLTFMQWDEIVPGIERFIIHAEKYPDEQFLLTPIGCGLAGHSTLQLMQTLKELRVPPNVFLAHTFANDWSA